ncbi:MAG: hypothetical protein NT051_02245 [Candidatus Micrarchaeota archaeon]|nr:hypothetical protein [Candidatus Micrarchaeota archaeon]
MAQLQLPTQSFEQSLSPIEKQALMVIKSMMEMKGGLDYHIKMSKLSDKTAFQG